MTQIKYETVSNDVREMIEKLINTFPDKFIHININDLHLTFRDSEKCTWKARTRLLNEFYRSLTDKKIGIEVWKQDWMTAKESQKAAVVYHELMHIVYDETKKVYKLRRHDVQDFYEMLQQMGLNYENADDVFSKFTKKEPKQENLFPLRKE